MKKRNKPAIRHKNFDDAWEQRQFNRLLDPLEGIRRGPFGSSLKKEYFIPYSNYVVYEQQNAINDNYATRYYISKEKFEELSRFKLSSGDYIMSGAGTIGRISMVPAGIKTGVFNQALIRIKISFTEMDPVYFIHWMRSAGMQKKLTEENPASAMVNLVPMSEIKGWSVPVPSLAEQRQIGRLFKKYDETITMYQRKLEKLENLKQAMLKKMFV